MDHRMQRLTQVKPLDVWCPHCHAMPGKVCPTIIMYRDENRSVHAERKAVQLRVRAILRSHFVVAERPCNGEAHQFGVDVDHCMVCLPNWGRVEYLTPRIGYFACIIRRGQGAQSCGHQHATIADAGKCARKMLETICIAEHVELRRTDEAELTEAEAAEVEAL